MPRLRLPQPQATCTARVRGGLTTQAVIAVVTLLLVLVASSSDALVLRGSRQPESSEEFAAAYGGSSGRFPKALEFAIHVITYNRPNSLKRLCRSLLAAKYFGHPVTLKFFVDAKLEPNRPTMDFVESFQWPYGPKEINVRARQGGLEANVVESWYPAHDDQYVLLAEDDIEVSEFWMRFVLESLAKYRYPVDPADRDDSIVGISLYSPRQVETIEPVSEREFHSKQTLQGISGNAAYFMQMPCSWGAVYFPEQWRVFRAYLMARYSIVQLACMGPGSYTTFWTGSWIKHYYEVMYFKGWYMLYPNYEEDLSFSTNHVEPGVHTRADDPDHPIRLFEVPLMHVTYSPPVFLPAGSTPVIDTLGRPSTREFVRQQGALVITNPNPPNLYCRCGMDCGDAVGRALGERWGRELPVFRVHDCASEPDSLNVCPYNRKQPSPLARITEIETQNYYV